MPWPVKDILDYLAERRIHVVRNPDGSFALRKHPDTLQKCFEAAVKPILPHVRERRAELLAAVQPGGPDEPRIGSPAWRRLPPAERRTLLIARAFRLAESGVPPGRVIWFSRYTMKIARAGKIEAIPLEATRISVESSTPGYFAPRACYARPSTGDDSVWVEDPKWREIASWELPWARTPPGFRDTANFPHPREWRPGPGFIPYTPTRAERSKVWREMWRVEVTPKREEDE